ncbi:MAG TPA: acyltransferase family protein [Mycobacteriales bacterium]|nr:acyltransferase family protein [Mycobacteriales bacterium]
MVRPRSAAASCAPDGPGRLARRPVTQVVASGTPTAPARTPRRDIALLRVLAILGVVMIHVAALTMTNDDLRDTRVWWVAVLFNQGGRFCVPLFVMVSGALVLRPGSLEPAADFFRKRLTRLVPALLTWHVVYIVFSATVLDARSDVGTVLSKVATGRTYTALYFFWLILGLYLVTPALRTLLAKLDTTQLVRAGLGLTALTCVWQSTIVFVVHQSRIDVSSTPTVFTYWIPYVGYFVLGGALVRLQVDRRRGWAALAVAALASLATVWLGSGAAPEVLTKALPTTYHAWTVAIATVALFVGVTGVLPPKDGATRVERVVDRLGGLTLGVFASHLLVLYALQHSGVLTVTHGASRLLELAYLGVGTVAGAFAVAWLLSLVPGLRRVV